MSGTLSFSRLPEGTPGFSQTNGSSSSRSDGSDFEPTHKSNNPSHRSFSSRYSFMSKPVHPVPFGDCNAEDELCGSAQTTGSQTGLHTDMKSNRVLTELQPPGFLEIGATSQRRTGQWRITSSIDFTDVSETLEPECSGLSYNNPHEDSKCGLCERFLSQRSPCGTHRIVRSGDMPVAGVLSCSHVYHAECLERTTPRTQKHDPPCPICEKSEESIIEQWALCRLKNGLPRLKPLGEEGPSRVWTCGQVGDCVEGALQIPKTNSMLLLNRSRLKRQLSLKGSSGKEWAESSKKSGLCASQVLEGRMLGDQLAVGCSKTAAGPALKRQ